MFIERECTVELNGWRYSAAGAVVTPDFAIGYLSGDQRSITTWHGEFLGQARITAGWKLPRGVFSDRMYQVEVIIGGRIYTGRCAGAGMIWRGKLKRGKICLTS